MNGYLVWHSISYVCFETQFPINAKQISKTKNITPNYNPFSKHKTKTKTLFYVGLNTKVITFSDMFWVQRPGFVLRQMSLI